MNKTTISFVLFLWTFPLFMFSQNLLDTSTWSIGSGSIGNFYANGPAAENIREWGKNHIGEDVILWKAVPDSNSNADGGWNSSFLTIDNTKTYRLSVWIKKTNSNDGYTYFGTHSYNGAYHLYRLDGSLDTNPYFFGGDLPKLDRWYLLIGFVHENSYSSTAIQGGIYDGLTGLLVQSIHRDFKFGTNASNISHRAYLFYDINTSDRQYFYAPRLEQINGSELSINELLSLNPDPKLVFAYDNSGNQKQRFYCPDGSSCSVPSPPAGKVENEKDIISKTESIRIFNTNSTLIETLKNDNSNKDLQVDLTGKPSGVYFLHIHMNDGSESITKKIIKE